MSHNCDMILFNFYRNWLIHKVLVSEFEGSNPSLTAKLQSPDGNIRAFCFLAQSQRGCLYGNVKRCF